MQKEEKRIWSGKTILLMLTLVSVVTAGIIALFMYGKNNADSKLSEFSAGRGYIISSTLTDDGVTSTRQYFEEDTLYKNTHSEEIEFKNSSGDDVRVDTNSFIHYDDGSIGVLKKVALLDPSKLKDKADTVVSYYNLMPQAVLRHQSGGYVAELHGERITFESILMKVSENKYLISAPEITIKIGDTEKKIRNSYLEFTIFDGNIIRVENQELTYQSISDEMKIIVGDTYLDLRNKYIVKNNVAVLDFALITITSDDNIALSDYELPEELIINDDNGTEEGGAKETTEKDPTADWKDLLSDLSSGIVETTTNPNEINEYERSNDPIFTITSFNVTANSFIATVEAEDRDGLLSGDTRIDIIELSNGNAVYQRRFTNGETFFDASTDNLSPETEYVFVITSNYMKDNAEVSKTFIQKTFITEAVGVSITENYVTTSSINVSLIRSEYSRVRGVTAVLVGPTGDEIASQAVNFESEGNSIVLNYINGVLPNTQYQLRLKDYQYLDMNVTNGFTVAKDIQTLKRRPKLGSPIFSIDKREGVFNVNIGETTDLDNGIKSYRYELYDGRSVTVDPDTKMLLTGTPVYTVDKETRSGVDIPVDGESIKRGVPYVYRVVATFDNNQFEYELATGISNVMKMDGKAFPTLTFVENEVTFERIDGKIIIIDDGGVFDTNKAITRVYQNSVGDGETEIVTANDRLEIPFYKDGLRKNESYTISLYGTVDMKDGNPAIDNCYIGSVVVQTKDTNPFELQYSVDNSNPNVAFSVLAKIIEGDEGSTELEANTLSGLTFNVYRGTDTTGTPMRSSQKFDDNEKKYESSLRLEYYDNEFIIKPNLFGLRNKDFGAGTYTIEVTGAYDYTKYKNSIPIKNNVFTIEVDGSIPDVPVDQDNAIELIPIYNEDLSEEDRRADLNNDTIVGYSMLADYDNSGRTLKELYYAIHSSDGTVVKEITYNLPAGQINPGRIEVFFDGDGTAGRDDDFRRGNEYYVTFTAGLDTIDSDGIVDIIWPIDGTTLKSKSILPKKQMPELVSYPVSSNDDTYNWRYRLTDVDHAVTTDLSYSINDVIIGAVPMSSNSSYQTMQFTNLTTGSFKTFYRYKLLKNDNETIINASNHLFDGIFTPTLPTYRVIVENNKASFEFTDIDENLIYDRTAMIKIVLRDSNDRNTLKTFDKLVLDESGIIAINLSEIVELVGQRLTPHVYLYYDNGLTGFEINNERIAVVRGGTEKNEYYSLVKGELSPNVTAYDSIFNYEFNSNTNQLTLNSLIDSSLTSIDLQPSSGGLLYNNNVILLKQLKEIDVTSSQFSFDTVVPSVRVNEITPDLLSASVNATIYGLSGDTIQNNKVYFDVFKSDSTWTSSSLIINNMEAPLNGSDIRAEITGLEVGNYYFIRVYAYVKDGEGYTRTQLYDMDEPNIEDKTYRFVTLSRVVIEDTTVDYYATSQADRYFLVNYTFDRVVTVDGIRYEIWEVDDEGTKISKIDLPIDNDTDIRKNMEKYIPIPSGSGVPTGKSYKVYIIPYAKSGEEIVDISETESDIYYFAPLMSPFIGINSSLLDNSARIRFSVKTIDQKKSVVGNNYNIKILDKRGVDVTPTEYANVSYDMNTTEYFYLSGFGESDEYSFVLTYTLDSANDGSSHYKRKTSTYTIRTTDINPYIGNVTIVPDSNNSSEIRLVFDNSEIISEVDSLRFLVSSPSNVIWEDQVEFIPNQVISDGGAVYYYFTLPNVQLSELGGHYIQLQFSNIDGNVIATSSLEYIYVGRQ